MRDAVLGVELGGVVAVADLDDVGAEEVRRRPAVEREVEHAVGQQIAQVADVEALEERRVAEDAPGEAVELRGRAPTAAGTTASRAA